MKKSFHRMIFAPDFSLIGVLLIISAFLGSWAENLSTSNSGLLYIHGDIYCTQNEYLYPKYDTNPRMCVSYEDLYINGRPCPKCDNPPCSHSCPGEEQKCLLLSVPADESVGIYGQSTKTSKCFCDGDKIPKADGSCGEPPDKCSVRMKDRYCDQFCTINQTDPSIPQCSCADGFTQQTTSRLGFGNYTECLPDTAKYKNLTLILNGMLGDDWSLPDTDITYLKERSSPARIQVHATTTSLNNIYTLTQDEEGASYLTTYSSSGVKLPDKVHPLFYRQKIDDFVIDWPLGYVYYISLSSPKLTVCNITGTACKILDASLNLTSPSEIILDPVMRKLLILDGLMIWKISTDGTKAQSMAIDGVSSNLAVDYINNYLYYLTPGNHQIHRIDYKIFTSPPQLILWLTKDTSFVEMTSMAVIGHALYLVEYHKNENKSYIYTNISTNPYSYSDFKGIQAAASGSGRLNGLFIYHPGVIKNGPSQSFTPETAGCHFILDENCVCMEGFYLNNESKTCTKYEIQRDNMTNFILYVSSDEALISSMFVPTGELQCPNASNLTGPVSPIEAPGGSRIISMSYDVSNGTVYFTDSQRVWKASVDGHGYRTELADIGAPTSMVGAEIQEIAVSTARQMLYVRYLVYQPITRQVLTVIRLLSLDTPSLQLEYLLPRLQTHDHGEVGIDSNIVEYYFHRNNDTSIGDEYMYIRRKDLLFHYDSQDKPTGSEMLYALFADVGSLDDPSTLSQNVPTVMLWSAGPIIIHSMTRPDGNTSAPLPSKECSALPKMFGRTVVYAGQTMNTTAPCDDCDGLCVKRTTDKTTSVDVCLCGDTASKDGCSSATPTCENDGYICPGWETGDKLCINRTQFCDKINDCPNGEDEHTSVCSKEYNFCRDGFVVCNATIDRMYQCVDKQREICDGVSQCPDGEDERHCPAKPACSQFTCPYSERCYHIKDRCDGIPDCPSFSYEPYPCPNCQPSAFKCPNESRCISKIHVCDGDRDCHDGSDEIGCDNSTLISHCSKGEMACKSQGQCIPEIWWCDGSNDCVDHSDEASCANVTCDSGLIKCNSTGKCIPPSYRCDTHFDCEDGEDESNCPVTCRENEYTCPASDMAPGLTMCVELYKVCDNFPDCIGSADEQPGCESGACDLNPCLPDQECIVNPRGGHWCLCPPGTELAEDGYSCEPLRRTCDMWGACSQSCTTILDDKVKCFCRDNYTIQENLYTCRHNAGPAKLIFSNRHDLRSLSAEPSSHYDVMISSLRNTIALDFHYAKQFVFWSDVIADKIYRGSVDTNSENGDLYDIKEVITTGLPTAEGLAVDWIGDHIYWVDSGLDIIEVADLDGKNRSTIISHSEEDPMENPRSIAVDPRVGLLFWADWGIKHIRRATMAGGDQKKLFDVNDAVYIPEGGWANGLTLDYDQKRVYWNDAKSDSIQTVDYDGNFFHLVLADDSFLRHPFAISVFENWVYWSDWRTNSINRANKWNGTDAQTVQGTMTQPFDLKVYHQGRQPPLVNGQKDLCAVRGCSDLCLRNSVNSVQCACRHLRRLDEDGKSCIAIEKFILLATSQYLTSVSLTRRESHGVMPTLAAPIIEDVYMVDTYITRDEREPKRLFWADKGLKAIATTTTSGDDLTTIIDLGQAVKFGLAVDYINKKLYITTYTLRAKIGRGTIDVCEFDGSQRATITTGLNQPTKLVLQPSNGTMFVVDDIDGYAAIYHMYMNGSFLNSTKEESNILCDVKFVNTKSDMRIAVSFDDHTQSQFYFGNGSHVYSYSGGVITTVRDYSESILGTWTVSENMLYYTSKQAEFMLSESFNISVQSLGGEGGDGSSWVGTVKGPFPEDIKVVSMTRSVNAGDRVKCNTQCTHHCLPSSPASPGVIGTCVCYTGYRLSTEGRCTPISPMLLYSTNAWSAGIYGLDLNATEAQISKNTLPSIPQIYKASSVAHYPSGFHSDNDYIYWIDSGHSITRINRDLTERKTIVSGLISAKDLTIDPQGDNLYWIDTFAGTIEVCRSDGSQRMILKHTDNKLQSIALHPTKGYLYYLESTIGISRIHLGTNLRSELITALPSGGNALAMDVQNSRLFVCDTLGQITFMNLTGGGEVSYYLGGDLSPTKVSDNSHQIVHHSNKSCTSIAVGSNKVYYVIPGDSGGEIWMKDITSNSSAKNLLTGSSSITDLALASQAESDHLGLNPCAIDNGGCDGLCLFNGDVTAASHCLCAMGVLDATKKGCTDVTDFLVFSKVNAIQFHNVTLNNPLAAAPYPDLSDKNRTVNVIALATDTDRKRIYYSDIQRKTISSMFYNGTGFMDVLTNMDPVEGLAYDNDRLYFTYKPNSKASPPGIQFIKLADTKPYKADYVLRLGPTDAPRAIAVHSCSGLIFWTNWNEASPSIQRCFASGAHPKSIVTKNIVVPNGLAIDHQMEKLFWADAALDKIEMCDFDGLDCQIKMSQASPHIFAMAIHGDYLYWTDWIHRSVKVAHKLYGSMNQTLVAKLPRQPMGIAIASKVTCKSSPCYTSSCPQTCTIVDNFTNTSCGCYDGYTIDPENVPNCIPALQGCNGTFACGGDCIPWELTCDGVNHCAVENGVAADENPAFCATRMCPNNYLTCFNHRCVSTKVKCNGFDDCGDLTDEIYGCDVSQCNSTTEFTCASKQCIPLAEVCDGVPHCWDKSDELPPHCNSSGSVYVDCSEFESTFYGSLKNGVKCPNTGVCILEEWKCDGRNDCWDNSDELNCDMPKSCGPLEWRCNGENSQSNNIKQCILSSWRCDGDQDCIDGSDEDNCEPVDCPEGDIPCGQTCVPKTWKCDGRVDCEGAADELGCPESHLLICPSTHFLCADNSSCVARQFLCDGESDCHDHSDEHPLLGCPPPTCGSEEIACANHHCIPREFQCDRYDDCLDNSDERGCSYGVCDEATQYTCSNSSQCIPLSGHCDDWPDCDDGSDESPDTCPPSVNSVCPAGQWSCGDTTCIDKSNLCDGQADCPDSEDELSCNLNECLEGNGGCEQICVDEPAGFHCGCKQGFRLAQDRYYSLTQHARSCDDINECEETTPCSQRCTNLRGTYACSCASNYTLALDKKTCKPITGHAYLLVANRYYIRNLTLHTYPPSNRSKQTLVDQSMTNAVGLDYDWSNQMLYWTDVTDDKHEISRMSFNGSNKEVLHSVTTKHPDGLAVDWVGGNLYWSDNILNTIEVSRLDGKHRKVLMRGVKEPRALQLHPAKGYLFYTDWGQGAHIGRMGMDGSNHRHIINGSIGWPNALAVDIYADKLFFGDAKLDYIAMANLDGTNRKIIMNHAVSHIFSLAIFEDMVYWSDWENKQIHKAHKFTGDNMITLAELIHRPMELRIVHELNQVYKFDNPCDLLHCEGLCLLKPGQAGTLDAECACPDYFQLSTIDNRTCVSECPLYSHFQCLDEYQCIHFTQRCDNHQDCDDGSDETNCEGRYSACPPFQMSCAGANATQPLCIEAKQICDGMIDCPHQDDELLMSHCRQYNCLEGSYKCHNSTSTICIQAENICDHIDSVACDNFTRSMCADVEVTCSPSEFKCVNTSQCIPYVFHCDGEPDCQDGSDESSSSCVSNVQCKTDYVSCNNTGQCIPKSWLCDGDEDCHGGGQDEDPAKCFEASCPDKYHQCGDKRCIPNRWLCDYENDCRDGSDELNCTPRECSESEVKCKTDGKCIHTSQRCDGIPHCSDGSDEKDCDCGDGKFKCGGSGLCIPLEWKCDNTADCQDQSDEINCTKRNCSSGEFQCRNSGLCIPSTFICDAQSDCGDSSDETPLLCRNNTCLPDRFRCGNSKCIPVSLLCDTNDDCGDNSDENVKNCKERGCGPGKFKCPNDGVCIDESKVCDGKVDCPYLSKAFYNSQCLDKNDGCETKISNDEQNNDFVCRRSIGACTNVRSTMYFIRSFMRSRQPRVDRCTNQVKCEEQKNATSLVKLSCERGYQINLKYARDYCMLCEDKNECLEYGTCSQLCNNEDGGYSCECQDGYSLVNSNRPGSKHDCVLKSSDPAYLLLAEGYTLRSVELRKRDDDRQSTHVYYFNETSRIDSISIDTTSNQWTAYILSYHKKSILKTNMTSLQKNDRRKRGVTGTPTVPLPFKQLSTATSTGALQPAQVLKSDLGNPSSIAFDWVHKTLYWVDSSAATITLLQIASGLEATVVSPQSMARQPGLNIRHISPKSITIDPTYSNRIFWTECCVRSRIWSADLDGGDIRMLTDQLEWPSDIVVDIVNKRLYWTDSKHRTVSSMTVDGDDIRTVHTFAAGDMQPNKIDIFGRELFITSLDRSKVVTLDKFAGLHNSSHDTNITSLFNSQVLHAGDLVVVHPAKLIQRKDPPVCKCGTNAIMTETYHEGNNRCSCMCANNWVRFNESDCRYCPCINNGTCLNNPDEPVRCQCPPSYGGERCELHMCKDYCDPRSECEVINNQPYCKCPGYLTGERCDRFRCEGFQCQNNGTCIVDDGGLPYCVCKGNYHGDNCEEQYSDPCTQKCGSDRVINCQKADNEEEYNCQCSTNYAGQDCQLCVIGNRVTHCGNYGRCSVVNNRPQCECNIGNFSPESRCQESVCHDFCFNGGTCYANEDSNGVKKPHCHCMKYFSGKHCELRTKCNATYCQNEGKCVENPVDSETQPATCDCTANHTGVNCQLTCKTPCNGGKVCKLQPDNTTQCVCPEGDDSCTSRISKCDNYCFNGGTCVDCQPDENMCSSCSCTSKWTGERCESRVEVATNQPATNPLKPGVIGAIIGAIVIVILTVLVIVLVVIRKRQRRRMLFEHLRLTEDRDDGTMHVSNPMYMKNMDEEDELEPEDDNFSVYSTTNTSNFANPLHSAANIKKSKKKDSERSLLINHSDDEEDL